MTRKTIPLGYLIELVASFAVGIWLLRYELETIGFIFPRRKFVQWSVLPGSFLLGFSAVQGLGLSWETTKKRGPTPWGLGRRTWVIVNAFALLTFVVEIPVALIHADLPIEAPLNPTPTKEPTGLRRYWTILQSPGFWDQDVNAHVLPSLVGWVPFVVGSLWLTDSFSRQSRGKEPDAREWAGRVFGLCQFVYCLVSELGDAP